MQVEPAVALWFSESLLRVYVATTVAEVEQGLAWAADELARRGCIRGRLPLDPQTMQWLHTALREAAEHCRSRLAPGARGAVGTPPLIQSLTRREREVVHRISLGETDSEIGRALGISPKTASKHVENILRKLCVETRTAAAAVALASDGRREADGSGET